MRKYFTIAEKGGIPVASEASDPTFKTIHFQYYNLVALIQINNSGRVRRRRRRRRRRWWRRRRRRRRRRRSRFQGVETPPKPIHISKNQLCRMKSSSAKGAQIHLLVNIWHSFFFYDYFSVWQALASRTSMSFH